MDILNRKGIKSQAREFIGTDRKWFYMALACIPLTLIQAAMNDGIDITASGNGTRPDTTVSLPLFLSLAAWLLIPFTAAMGGYFLNHLRGYNPNWKSLYHEGIDYYGSYFKVGFTNKLFVSLWMILFIIPGIIKHYQWFFDFYIIHDNPKLSHKQARNLSKRMTDGFKGDLFVLDLSFLLWYMLVGITLGIASIYVTPYVQCTYAMYYENLKHNALATGIATPEEFGIMPINPEEKEDSMKYVVVLYDGMADYPVPEFDGKTPMMMADKPNFDALAQKGTVGLVKTVPDGMKPGSDVANMSVMGFDPSIYYTGRSPLEAASIGVDLKDTDVTLRCNVVTLSDEENYADKTMVDYCADDISTEEAEKIIATVQEHFGNDIYKFYSGVSYRHCLVWDNGTTDLGNMTPPHDISGRVVGEYLSTSENATDLIRMMKESYDLLKDHPVNIERIKNGKRPANSIWLWGEGKKPALSPFEELYGIKGAVISAVDLLKGIGKCAKMETPDVEGATGYIDTNFKGKAQAAVDALKNGCDFAYIHIEAPDECGHRREAENKVSAIEIIDEQVLPIVLDGLKEYDDYKILILPDHPTPIITATHASDPVPFMMYHKSKEVIGVDTINEETAKATGLFVGSGVELMKKFLED